MSVEYIADYRGTGIPAVRDALGNEYTVGDRVVYGTTVGRSPVVRVAEVVKIEPKETKVHDGVVFLDELPREELSKAEDLTLRWHTERVTGHRPVRKLYRDHLSAKVTVRPVATARSWSKITRTSQPTVENILRFDSPVKEDNGADSV